MVSAQGWSRRVYFDSLTCIQGNITQVILSYDPRIPCPPAGSSSLNIGTWPCEQKSKLAGSLSSEATECDTQPAGAVSDAPWFPTGANKLAASNYLSVITYTSTGPAITIPCSVEGNTTAVDIKTYAANGNCYANEVGYYFKVVLKEYFWRFTLKILKALCSSTGGQIVSCSDSTCLTCSAPTTVSSSCQSSNLIASKAVCSIGGGPSAASFTNLPPPATAVQTTSSSTAPTLSSSSSAPTTTQTTKASSSFHNHPTIVLAIFTIFASLLI
ncbi:hypothetical protein HK096_002325 [Nowakowskiella sp. JEL0078]|nr:hypothetical protein HK096_002325 [Nowakowskiella sp. JEL0078]